MCFVRSKDGFISVSPGCVPCVSPLTALPPLGQLCGGHPQYVTQLEGPLLLRVAGPLPAPQEAAPGGHHNKSVVGVQVRGRCLQLGERKREEIRTANKLTTHST